MAEAYSSVWPCTLTATARLITLAILIYAVGAKEKSKSVLEEGYDVAQSESTDSPITTSDSLGVLPTAGTRNPRILRRYRFPLLRSTAATLTPFSPEARQGSVVTTSSSLESNLFKLSVPLSVTSEQAAEMEARAAAAAAAAATDNGSLEEVAIATIDPIYNEILDQHNIYRNRHQAQALTWSDALSSAADAYASRCVWAHDPDLKTGENLYLSWDKTEVAGNLRGAIITWYNEGLYDYGSPGFSMQTGHFTQVVWNSSTLLGCVAKVCDQIQGLPGWTEGGTLVICRYFPPGNVQGQYEDNVFPPAASAPAPATIPGGWVLKSTSCLSSVDARFSLCVQDNANIVLYQGRRAIWGSHTIGRAKRRPFRLAMQTDGSLVAYDGLGKPYWNGSVPTATSSPPYRAVVENDGNFVVYGAVGPIWATNTCCL